VIDFTGAEAPGPVMQVIDNLFMGGDDDGLDLDGTDAFVSGNIFMDFRKDSSNTRSTTSNAIATGLPQTGAPNRTRVTAVRNLFLNCNHAVLLKEEAFLTAENNTFVGMQLAVIQFNETVIPSPTVIPSGGFGSLGVAELELGGGMVELSDSGANQVDTLVYGLLVDPEPLLSGEAWSAPALSYIAPLGYSAIVAIWSYEDSDTDLGTAWRASAFDDSAWLTGAALLGRETSPQNLPKTLETIINYASGKSTYYFRHRFQFSGDPAEAELRIRSVVDDGAVFYLNGVEIHRLRMNNPVGHGTFASANVGDANYEGPFDLSATGLIVGENVLAVEVHQDDAGSIRESLMTMANA
jgi:hypothetical protein